MVGKSMMHFKSNFVATSTGSIKLPNGRTIKFTNIGSVPLTDSIVLHNVLFVPDFNFNLSSVSKFVHDHHCCVLFYPRSCVFQDLLDGTILGIGRERNGLYRLDTSSFTIKQCHMHQLPKLYVYNSCKTLFSAMNHVQDNTRVDDLWHQRLGHISLLRMKMLPFLHRVSDLSSCHICPQSKQTRLSFPTKRSSSSTLAFQLVHMDVWGPFNTPTYNGEKYFLTIVDDYTKVTWVYLMHSKLDVASIIKNYVHLVRNQFSTLIKMIRTDNDTEFFQQECKVFFASLGIIHQSSCPYTPQQNCLVERKHRHIVDVARCLKFQAFLPRDIGVLVFLLQSILSTATPLLSNKTPFEMLFLTPPSYSHLKVFGCLCYATTLPRGDKFAARADICVFLGYSNTQKGYRLQNLLTKRFFVARDVVFQETSFPFARFTSHKDSHVFPLVDSFVPSDILSS